MERERERERQTEGERESERERVRVREREIEREVESERGAWGVSYVLDIRLQPRRMQASRAGLKTKRSINHCKNRDDARLNHGGAHYLSAAKAQRGTLS